MSCVPDAHMGSVKMPMGSTGSSTGDHEVSYGVRRGIMGSNGASHGVG